MKKLLVVLGLLAATGLPAAPLLVEAYQEGSIEFPANEGVDTLEVVELNFSIDTTSLIQVHAGGIAETAYLWLEANGTRLHPRTKTYGNHGVSLTWSFIASPGEHAIVLKLANIPTSTIGVYTRCQEAYLQALIFLPDTASAVAEQPIGDAQPEVKSPNLVSKGPYVDVAGATRLVDSSGRIVEDVIKGGKVYINKLSPGTYFARDGQQTIVKIVKVE